MVVSAILLTALAPITGALFGASYGTSIRIGYEIIFPALFGDMINDQKNKTSQSTEDGAKRTIKALHTMFTATGGASAMEFGIEQGIELAKKKTESPAVQNMIALNLGLTDQQLKQRGRFNQGTKEQQQIAQDEADLVESAQEEGFATPPAEIDEIAIMRKNYPNTPVGNKNLCNIMNIDSYGFNDRSPKQRAALSFIYKERLKINPNMCKTATPEEAITSSGAVGAVKQIALLYAKIANIIKNKSLNLQQRRTVVFPIMTQYNRLVQSTRNPATGKTYANLTIDTGKTIASMSDKGGQAQGTIIPKS